jgi:hypothetical protein
VVEDGNAPVRYMGVFNSKWYAVVGENVYLISSLLAPTLLGSINTDIGPVFMTVNNAGQVILVDGVDGWIYDPGTGDFLEITTSDFPGKPLGVVYQDDYFLIPDGETNIWYLSGPNDGFSWDVLDTATIRKYTGYVTGIGVVGSRVYFFKEDSTEVWFNQGLADFPFRRDNNLIFNTGCTAPGSIYQLEGYLYWLSNASSGESTVMMTKGGQANIISTQAINTLINGFTNPDDVQAYAYKDSGHQYYVMSWTEDDVTLVFDQTMAEAAGIEYAWFRMATQPKREQEDQPYSAKTRHWSSCHVHYNGVNYVGDYRKPVIYSMSLNYPDNAGEPIRRERIFRHSIQPAYQYQQIDWFQVDFRQGVGANSSLPSLVAPQAYLSLSKNGGISFVNEQPAPLGRVGEYTRRTIWRMLGIHRDFVGKIAVYSDVAPIYMLGGAIDIKNLRN